MPVTVHLSNWDTLVTALALAAGIMLTRFIPFLLFSRKEKLPDSILYLGGALPHASMTMLLVYCLKDVSLTQAPHGLPEALGIVFTAVLHAWRKNVLISIACGTAFYMILVQRVFVG